MRGTPVSIATSLHPLLVIARRFVIRVNGRIWADSLCVQRLGPCIDSVYITQHVVLINAVSIQFQHSALECHEFTDSVKPADTSRSKDTSQRKQRKSSVHDVQK